MLACVMPHCAVYKWNIVMMMFSKWNKERRCMLGRSTERNIIEQINKGLTWQWDVESLLPDRRLQYESRQRWVNAALLVSEISIILVKETIGIAASPVDSCNKETKSQEKAEQILSETLLAQDSTKPGKYQRRNCAAYLYFKFLKIRNGQLCPFISPKFTK